MAARRAREHARRARRARPGRRWSAAAPRSRRRASAAHRRQGSPSTRRTPCAQSAGRVACRHCPSTAGRHARANSSARIRTPLPHRAPPCASMPNNPALSMTQERPEAFAAAEQRVAHGGVQAAALFRPAFCKYFREALLDEPRGGTEPLHERHFRLPSSVGPARPRPFRRRAISAADIAPGRRKHSMERSDPTTAGRSRSGCGKRRSRISRRPTAKPCPHRENVPDAAAGSRPVRRGGAGRDRAHALRSSGARDDAAPAPLRIRAGVRARHHARRCRPRRRLTRCRSRTLRVPASKTRRRPLRRPQSRSSSTLGTTCRNHFSSRGRMSSSRRASQLHPRPNRLSTSRRKPRGRMRHSSRSKNRLQTLRLSRKRLLRPMKRHKRRSQLRIGNRLRRPTRLRLSRTLLSRIRWKCCRRALIRPNLRHQRTSRATRSRLRLSPLRGQSPASPQTSRSYFTNRSRHRRHSGMTSLPPGRRLPSSGANHHSIRRHR